MKRIVSKVDYELYQRGQVDPRLALDLWFGICKNISFIESAIEIKQDNNGEKCFFAPAICHMILSNPWDVDKKLYDRLVLTLLNNPDLNKISVFGNMTFLCLIIFNGAFGFDDWYLHLTSDGINKKTQEKHFEVKRVIYDEVLNDGNVSMSYKNNDLDISLSDSEIERFSKGDYISLNTVFGYEEIEKLVEIANIFPGLDERILRSIDSLHQTALNYQQYEQQSSITRI